MRWSPPPPPPPPPPKTAQSAKSATTPGFTMLASSSTSQLVSRTQPCEPALSISEGSGDPLDAVGRLGEVYPQRPDRVVGSARQF